MDTKSGFAGVYAAGRQNQYMRTEERETVVALAGNPNVGKSTVFNALTNLHQHTGNWPGKTVVSAQGLLISQITLGYSFS